MRLILTAISHWGEGYLKRNGNHFDVLQELDDVACLNHDPGYLIRSTHRHAIMWIRKEHDANFEIEVVHDR